MDKEPVVSAQYQLSSMCPMPRIMPVFDFNNYIRKALKASSPMFLKLPVVKLHVVSQTTSSKLLLL